MPPSYLLYRSLYRLQMGKWGYAYIENLTWVWMGPGNAILAAPSPFLRNSHLTLYIFRKAGGCLPGVSGEVAGVAAGGQEGGQEGARAACCRFLVFGLEWAGAELTPSLHAEPFLSGVLFL